MFWFWKKIDKEIEESDRRWMEALVARIKPTIDVTPEPGYQEKGRKEFQTKFAEAWDRWSPGERGRVMARIWAVVASMSKLLPWP